MTSPIIALRAAVLVALCADVALSALLNGPQIYEDAPRTANPPFVTFGDVAAKDWSTSSDIGMEQVFTLHIWSKQTGMRASLTIADRISALLQDAALVLNGHALIALHLTNLETKHEDSGRWLRTSLRFRAVTEPR